MVITGSLESSTVESEDVSGEAFSAVEEAVDSADRVVESVLDAHEPVAVVD